MIPRVRVKFRSETKCRPTVTKKSFPPMSKHLPTRTFPLRKCRPIWKLPPMRVRLSMMEHQEVRKVPPTRRNPRKTDRKGSNCLFLTGRSAFEKTGFRYADGDARSVCFRASFFSRGARRFVFPGKETNRPILDTSCNAWENRQGVFSFCRIRERESIVSLNRVTQRCGLNQPLGSVRDRPTECFCQALGENGVKRFSSGLQRLGV